MKDFFGKYIVLGVFFLLILSIGTAKYSLVFGGEKSDLHLDYIMPLDSPEVDLPYPFGDYFDPSFNPRRPFSLDVPSNVQSEVEYDIESGRYIFKQNMNGINFRPPTYMTLDEYLNYDMEKFKGEYFDEKVKEDSELHQDPSLIPTLKVGGEMFDRIFGGNTVDIRPQGSAELIFGVNVSRTENPAIPERQRRIAIFDFDQRIQMNVVGKIGEKMQLGTQYNTEAMFDFENQIKLEYNGFEDEIIKSIEAGNVTLPLQGSLIQGSQSLFGIKTVLQFGRLTATTVLSQEKGEKKVIETEGGAQTTKFQIKADEYEANRHYFIGHYFRDNYDRAAASLPIVNSNVVITRMEVWVTNQNFNVENTRNFVAFTDLGERQERVSEDIQNLLTYNNNSQYTSNQRNNLYEMVSSNPDVRGFSNSVSALNLMGLKAVDHFEKVENARMLEPSEYTVNERLGFISLNQSLNNDEVLGIAFEYTIGGETFQVGELSTDGVSGQNALILKMLKATNFNVESPVWDLMMKNVYNLGGFQISRENFMLFVEYNDPKMGVYLPYLPVGDDIDGKPLLQVLNLDRLDMNNQNRPDGMFDFIDNAATQGGTINSRNGRVYFPVIEPFGSHLHQELIEDGLTEDEANRIAFQPLYDSTKTAALQIPQLNRFRIRGQYQASGGGEIPLNSMNVPEGSVTVTAGGVQLKENVDYTVDYTLGRVKIINQGLLESQTPIQVSLESNTLFSIQQKTMMGTHLDYRVNKDFNVGATILNLRERPLTQKVNIGDEPINNTIWGVNTSYRTESEFLTKMIDKIPFISTKEVSTIEVDGEFAHLIPGHSRAIGDEGISYIDDFEGSQSTIDLRAFMRWRIASTPQGQPNLFPEGDLVNDLEYGYNRAKVAWYVIDPLFFRNNNLTPDHIRDDEEMQSDHRMREVLEKEVFPNRELPTGTPTNIPVLDVAYYPRERGPYNYNPNLDQDGNLPNPEQRWGGIMRDIQNNDFELANIEYVQFWLMDPFNEDQDPNGSHRGGDLYINLGNISEDILRDGRKSYENGLPTSDDFNEDDYDQTVWGIIPTKQTIVNAFDNDPASREFQDVGLDGLSDAQEREFFADFIQSIQNNPNISNAAKQRIVNDPSADNYNYYRDDDYDDQELSVMDRYKMYNGLEGNSPTAEQSATMNDDGFPTQMTTMPDMEDINLDNNLSENENYYQYRISIRREDMVVGQNYITDRIRGVADTRDGTKEVDWYQFKVPIRNPDAVINNIQDFRSIRFMRIFMKGFDEPVVLRFARLEFLRGEWRKFLGRLRDRGESLPSDHPETVFNIAAVNIEENGNRYPINYQIPPGIQRQINVGTANLARLNEQSLVLEVCNLRDGDARAAFRNMDFDIRAYKKLRMFIHAESQNQEDPIDYGDLTVFIRLGQDFNQNYYEYEVPVTPSEWFQNAPADVWPEENNMEIEFQQLFRLKRQRDNDSWPIFVPYEAYDEDFPLNRITVMGNPNLAEVTTVMIGVRNPSKDDDNPWGIDDGLPKCAEIWVNELRLTDFDQRGGWAAAARMSAKLADFGNFNVAASITTPFFGSIEKRVSERSRETLKTLDTSTNLELGKFFPEKTGIKIPMFLNYSETVSSPLFDPLSPDQEFSDVINDLDADEAARRRRISEDFLKRRSMNFTNVRKERTESSGDPTPFDVENFSLTYSYAEMFMRDINIERNATRNYRGVLNYNFTGNPTPIKPFDKVKFLKSKHLKLIKDFNFFLGPRQLTFQSDMHRMYGEQLIRVNTPGAISFPTVNKTFNWNRMYNMQYDLTQNLSIDFSANNQAFVNEPEGRVNRDEDPVRYGEVRDTIMDNLRNFGETTNYSHNTNVNYTLPFNKIPLLDFINSTAIYSAGYDWQRAPFSQDTLGNTIQNSRTITLNGQLNMTNLYNKVGFLKKINQKSKKKGGGGGARRAAARRPNAKDDEEDDDKKKKDEDKLNVFEHIARMAMSLKNVSFNYSQNEGIFMPGFDRRTNLMGMDQGFSAPGLGFIFGQQTGFDGYDEYAFHAADRGWLVSNQQLESLNQQYATTSSKQVNIRATLEPLPDLRIELNATQNESYNSNQFFRFDEEIDDYRGFSRQQMGNLSFSTIASSTAFISDLEDFVSPVFQEFLENRQHYSQVLGEEDENSTQLGTGYYDGYGSESQQVAIMSFIATYTGSESTATNVNEFMNTESSARRGLGIKPLALPNWRITYDGLSKLDFLKKYFNNVTISHGYQSTFNVANYQTNLQYDPDQPLRDQSEEMNFLPRNIINSVNISEQFSPLLNIDMTWKNSLITKVEYKTGRDLAFSLNNFQLTELKSNEIVIGSGYRFQDVELPFKVGGKTLKSDLNLRADVSIRSNTTITRKMIENQNQVTAGQRVISIKTAIDYVVSERLNVRLFYDRVVTQPFVSTTFPTANTSAGVSLRFTLS